jgi:hypothetical protein
LENRKNKGIQKKKNSFSLLLLLLLQYLPKQIGFLQNCQFANTVFRSSNVSKKKRRGMDDSRDVLTDFDLCQLFKSLLCQCTCAMEIRWLKNFEKKLLILIQLSPLYFVSTKDYRRK